MFIGHFVDYMNITSWRKVAAAASCTSTPWFMQSIIVLIIDGTTELGMACNAIGLCEEPRNIDTTLELRVAHPMKTGRRRSCEYRSSSVKNASDFRSRNGYLRTNQLKDYS